MTAKTRGTSTPKRTREGSPNRYRGRHQQQIAQRRRRVLWGTLSAVASLVLIVLAVYSVSTRPKVSGGTLPGLQVSPAPWSPEYVSLPARLAALRLPPNGDESYHIHAHLAIYVKGQPVTVPANVGISFAARLESPMHTHDTSGAIHIEASQPSDAFNLGAFFDIWGVKFTATQLGGYTDTANKTVQVYVNGQPVADATRYVLHPHDDIVVGYGAPGSVPKTVAFSWPPGL